MPTFPRHSKVDYDEQLVAQLTARLGLPAPEIVDGADDHSAGDGCPSCTSATLTGKPPHYCRGCGWSSIQPSLETVPDPEAPRIRSAFDDPHIHQHAVADELVDTTETVDTRLVKAGYLSPMTDAWRLTRDDWQTQYDHYGQPDLLAYLLRDALTVFTLVSAADSGYSDIDDYQHHVRTRDRQRIGTDPAKNAVETLFWLEAIDAPTDPEEVPLP